jgi:hypothetical protein
MLRFLRSRSFGPTGQQVYVSVVVFDRDPLVPLPWSGHGSVMSRRQFGSTRSTLLGCRLAGLLGGLVGR